MATASLNCQELLSAQVLPSAASSTRLSSTGVSARQSLSEYAASTDTTSCVQKSPWDKKIILSLDGGGVRGYSTLIIIQELMKLCQSIESEADPPADSSYHPIEFLERDRSPHTKSLSFRFLPAHYFDYIAGSSTGGLIAIMLSRLRMSVDECMEEYETMGDEVFGHPRTFSIRGPIPWNREKFCHRKLERCIKDVVRRRSRDNDSLGDSILASRSSFPDRCRTMVIATRETNSSDAPYIFRSYDHYPNRRPIETFERNAGPASRNPIWQVARATTAAPTYFAPFVITNEQGLPEKFLDGGFGSANNPTSCAYFEVKQMNEQIALALSLGTGMPDKIGPVAKRSGLLGKVMHVVSYAIATATDAQRTHVEMTHVDPEHYVRFNVDGGLGSIDLGEWRLENGCNLTLDNIRGRTLGYLAQVDVRRRLREVADILVENRRERSLDPGWDIVATGRRFRCLSCAHKIFDREAELRAHLLLEHLGVVDVEACIKDGTILHAG